MRDGPTQRPDVVFVSKHVNWGTAIARGQQVRQAWQRKSAVIGCDTPANSNVERDLRKGTGLGWPRSSIAQHNYSRHMLIIHIKYVCRPALSLFTGAAHAFDPLDQINDMNQQSIREWSSAFHAVLSHSEAHARLLRSLVRVPIFVVPHHALPGCQPQALGDSGAESTVLVIGLNPPSSSLVQALAEWSNSRGGVRIVYEREHRLAELRKLDARAGYSELRVATDPLGRAWVTSLCALVRSARAAIAWDQVNGTGFERSCHNALRLSSEACYAFKPNERLLNPLALGVPAIGFARYPAFREVLAAQRTTTWPSTDRGGQHDLGTCPHCGDMLLAGSVDELTSSLDQIVLNRTAHSLAQAFGLQAARAFSLDAVVGRYEDLYTRLVLSRRSGESRKLAEAATGTRSHATAWPFRTYDPWTDKETPRAHYLSTHIEVATAASQPTRRSVRPSYADAMSQLHARDIWNQRKLAQMHAMLGIAAANTISPTAAPRFMRELIMAVRPRFVVEVGSFLGASAIEMARGLDAVYPDDRAPFVMAVDTWLGDSYMWGQKRTTRCKGCDQPYFDLLHSRDGMPMLYYQFLFNVAHAGMHHRVVPFPIAANEAARLLDWKGWRPDLVYIDASHGALDVLQDLEHYWHLLRCGGAVFGDDFHWTTVRAAVESFAGRRNLTLEVYEIEMVAGLEVATPRAAATQRFAAKNSKWVIRDRKRCLVT